MATENNRRKMVVYAGYVNDENKLLKSTSGGIATALAEQMIERGGYVAGVVYSENFRKAEYIVTNDINDIEKFKGSKYIDSDKNHIYRKVKALLQQGKQVLFVGLPCTVAGLYNFLGYEAENLLTCELICHGPTTTKVHEEYISYLEKKYKSEIVEFSVRRKKDAWLPPYLYAKFKNGKEFMKPFYSTEYGFAFSIFGKAACYNCHFKGTNHCADIMIGDFWGATEKDAFWNNKGVSSIFAETEKGNKALKMLRSIKLFPTTFERAVENNPMVIKSRPHDTREERFRKLFEKKGLIYAARYSVGFKQRLKNLAFKIFHLR